MLESISRPKPDRRRFLKVFGASTLGTGLAAFGGFQYGTRVEPLRLRLERVEIPCLKLPPSMDGFKIVFMSDFHLYPHTRIEQVIEAVDVANSCKPDLVALGGDYVLSTAEAIFELAPALAKLNARVGVFSILGNHDHWQGDEIVVQGLTQSGIPVLRNTGLTIDIGRDQFYLAGTDDGWVRRNDLKSALESRPEGLFTLLLMHEPDFADEASSDGRVAIQLSGHSHGGQVRLPLYGSPFLPPYGRKYDMGLYKVGDMQLYTNVGIGVTAPIRLNCPPEVTEFTLTRA